MASSNILLTWTALAFLVSASIGWSPAANFRNPVNVVHRRRPSNSVWLRDSSEENNTSRNDDVQTKAPSSTPILNGKRVLPFKVMTAGLKGHKVAAVYAVLNSSYKRGYAGWENCEYVGVSMDLDAALSEHLEELGSDRVAHIRALSFPIPSPGAMEEVANDWKDLVREAGGFDKDSVLQAIEAAIPYDDDDDDDEEDEFDEDFIEMRNEALAMTQGSQDDSGQVISPFESTQQPAAGGDGHLPFNLENVDKVLEEVRPYLISDGGNVSVERVDEEKKDVYLKLEGACGSCASSTVTMQMGIERVLKENFADLNSVLQVEDEETKVTELTYQAVEAEVNRIKPAIIAMGGGVEIVNVDSASGTVEIKFRGANKVRQGLELAITDIEFVKEVKFAEWDN